MFIRYYVELPLAPEGAERALRAAPPGWLPALAGAAASHGEGLLAEVGIGSFGPRLGVPVTVWLGDPIRFPGKILLPMTWEPAKASGLFPRLDADLELGQLGPGRTQLALNGRYQPPLGRVGQAVDRALLHRVAEATVKDFLDRVAEAVQASADGAQLP